MNYYTNLFSPDTYETFARGDKTVSGFSRHQHSWAHRIVPGDRFVCYMTKLSRWVGVLEVESECFIDETPIYGPDDPFVVRFRVRPVVWLPRDSTLPIREARVWDRLSFTKGLEQHTSVWTGKIRTSLNRLSAGDGDFLLQELLDQQSSGRTYPVDEDDYRRLLAQTVRRNDKVVPVTVPTDPAPAENLEADSPAEPVRESIGVQALLARVGEQMGFRIWLPKQDRPAVLREWSPSEASLLGALPLNYDEATLRTIEQIDVLWLKGRSIARAFEVEHTTAVYSGLLRMADLLALQPNMDIRLHIVAPEERREKVMSEVQRPVFSLLEKGPLSESCTYLPYGAVRELAALPHLRHLSDSVLDEYAEVAE